MFQNRELVPATPTAAYVHVPFCVHRCGYCDFTVITQRDDLLDTFLDCLESEVRRTLVTPHPVTTLFVGGGTPSYLPASHLKRLLESLTTWLPLQPDGEFTVECNPEKFTPDRMDALAAAGVNRISLGVQSFDPRHLKTLERSHSPQTVADVVAQLRQRGVNNVSFDLIFAVPGQTLDEWAETLRAAVALNPEHISTYGLTYEKGTRFWTRREKTTLIPVADEIEREMYGLAMAFLPQHGFQQYELSNFARTGFESRHNQVYWNSAPYYGFGPGAAAFVNGIRSINHRSTTTWLRRIQAGESAIGEEEVLTPDLRRREAVMLGLRRTDGIQLRMFQDTLGVSVRDLAPAAYDRFLNQGLLEHHGSNVRLTWEGRFLADTVMAEFLA